MPGRLSVRLSVTLVSCIKTVQAIGSRNLHRELPQGLYFCDTISWVWVQGFPLNQDVKKGYPSKDVILPLLARLVWKRLQMGTDMLLIITSTNGRLFRFIHINDLDRPWTPQKGVLVNFSQFLNATHISTLNCDEVAGNRRTQPAYEIFNIKRGYFSSPSPQWRI